MRFGVLHCTFSMDTECFLLPFTDNEADEDVAGACVTAMWWCSPCPSPIPPTALASPFTTPGTGSELAAGVEEGRVANNHYGNGCWEKNKCSC